VTEPPDLQAGGDPPCWAHLVDGGEATPVSDGELARLVRDLADAVIICEPLGTITFWNDAATRVFGWNADDAIGVSLDLIIPPRLRDRHWHGYRTVMSTGTTSYADRLLEVPALHRDGHTISIAFTVSLLTAPDGATTAIAAVIREDTERWQEGRAMRRELDRLRAEPAETVGFTTPH